MGDSWELHEGRGRCTFLSPPLAAVKSFHVEVYCTIAGEIFPHKLTIKRSSFRPYSEVFLLHGVH